MPNPTASAAQRQARRGPGRGFRRGVAVRPTRWWLDKLRQRAAGMYDEQLDLSQPIHFADEAERDAVVRFFNAAYRAEESGLQQAHELAKQFEATDPELAEALRLYGDEEGWHRELLVAFLAHIGGEVRPMGNVTATFYKLYARAERMDTIVMTNLMFETIGATTYRLTLRHASHPTVRRLLTILTRDESFHVPLNVHFLREVLRRDARLRAGRRDPRWAARLRLKLVYKTLFVALVASTIASRRRTRRFDHIPVGVLARAYTEQLAGLFLNEPELDMQPPRWLLRLFGLTANKLENVRDQVAIGVAAAERAADRHSVQVSAL